MRCYVHRFHGSHTAEHVKQTIEEMQRVRAILYDNVRDMKKAIDDVEVPSVVHTHCVRRSPRLVPPYHLLLCQCFNSVCRIRKSHMK